MTEDSTKNIQNDQQEPPMRYELRNRYVFAGELEMKTGLHIGGGKVTLSYTDSPVVLTPEGLPFIPGSSFKGTLRSTIEKMVASLPADLGLHSCGLPTEEIPDEPCPTARQREIADKRRFRPNEAEKILKEARAKLCQTCQLFGSPYSASRITINDLYLIDDEWSGATQIRDGVAIDRDSETAKSGAKYDFEVVPSTTTFKLYIMIENATEQDLQLISIGLSEFISGFGSVGGFRSRGLGACILKNLSIRAMRLTDDKRKQRLQRYLLRKKDGKDDGLEAIEDAQAFFDEHINTLFKEPQASNS